MNLIRIPSAMTVLSPRQTRWLVGGVALLVVGSVIWAAAGATWHVMGKTGGRPNPAPVAVATAGPRVPTDLSGVFAQSPFGAPVRTAMAGGTGVAGLVLKSVVVSGYTARSSAVIAANGAPARVYQIGDTLEGGAVIDSIATDHVVLRVAGHNEILTFPPRAGAPAATTTLPAQPFATAGSTAPAPAPSARDLANPLFGMPGQGGAASTTPLGAVQDLRQKAADNPGAMLAGLGASATSQGYRLDANLSPDMRRAGLLPGDLIQKINGSAVGNVDRDRSIVDAAIASGGARVELVRSGRTITLSFPIR